MTGWWVAEALESSPVLLVSWVVWVIGSIILHELAHGWMAIRLGDRTPIETGHMTWNPLVHMGGMSLIVFAVIGIAWGAMPVNPTRLRGRHADALVSFAGPAMNLSLAIVAVVLLALWVAVAGGYWFPVNVPDTLFGNVQTFLRIGAVINVVLMLFNLLPVPPLDGSRIVASFHPPYARMFQTERGELLGLGLFVAIFFFGAGMIFDTAGTAVAVALDALLGILAPQAV